MQRQMKALYRGKNRRRKYNCFNMDKPKTIPESRAWHIQHQLHSAATWGDCGEIIRCIEKGANPDKERLQFTPLMAAIQNSHQKACWTLLRHGASPNAKNSDGVTALMQAAGKRDEAVCLMLIRSGADVSARDSRLGDSALDKASNAGHVGICALLLAHGADVNGRGFCGATPLHRAALSGSPELCRFLLEKGADPYIRTSNGHTAFQMLTKGHTPIRKLIAESCIRHLDMFIERETCNAFKRSFMECIKS